MTTRMNDEVWGEVLAWIDYAAPTRIKRKAWQLSRNTMDIELELTELERDFAAAVEIGDEMAAGIERLNAMVGNP